MSCTGAIIETIAPSPKNRPTRRFFSTGASVVRCTMPNATAISAINAIACTSVTMKSGSIIAVPCPTAHINP